MCHTLKRGSVSKRLLVFARDPRDGRSGVSGLRHDSRGASAAWLREGDPAAHRIPLVAGTPGEHLPGGFAEVDADLAPGVYQFGVPDELLAQPSDVVVLLLRFADALVDPVEISLVAYDPQDGNRLGMAALGPEGRIAALRGAFPRLTARELGPPER
jgi:hypothetical protein